MKTVFEFKTEPAIAGILGLSTSVAITIIALHVEDKAISLPAIITVALAISTIIIIHIVNRN